MLSKVSQNDQPCQEEGEIFRGPNRRAALARKLATNIRPMMLSVPAMKEPHAAIPKAGPARPCLAIWYPSRHVMMEVASPGMFTRIDVVDPPYCVP